MLTAVLMGRSAADRAHDPAAHDARYATIIEHSYAEQRSTYAGTGAGPARRSGSGAARRLEDAAPEKANPFEVRIPVGLEPDAAGTLLHLIEAG